MPFNEGLKFFIIFGKVRNLCQSPRPPKIREIKISKKRYELFIRVVRMATPPRMVVTQTIYRQLLQHINENLMRFLSCFLLPTFAPSFLGKVYPPSKPFGAL